MTELTSYLLFDAQFCGRPIELGRVDVLADRARIERFFVDGALARSPVRIGRRRAQ